MTPLRQRMLDALEVRGMAVRTQGCYIEAVARLARHYNSSPERLSSEQVQQYLLHLLRERKLARSSLNQYGCAFRFLYGTVLGFDARAFQIPLAPAPQRLPEILSREELARLFGVARHLKADRDANLVKTVEKDGKQITVNRWNTSAFLISSASSNESGYLSVKVARGLGMVALDTQARI